MVKEVAKEKGSAKEKGAAKEKGTAKEVCLRRPHLAVERTFSAVIVDKKGMCRPNARKRGFHSSRDFAISATGRAMVGDNAH